MFSFFSWSVGTEGTNLENEKSLSSTTSETSKNRKDSEIQEYVDDKLNTKNTEILRLQKIIAEQKINESNHQTGMVLFNPEAIFFNYEKPMCVDGFCGQIF